ncbi:hypothetical protein EXIGLDRAFT_653952 [Exidia glandulosa HHB12029]|uniref:Zn(2)-C6 fungal-type domain-containing protein n=1 Tax=Exidia glandulosa HHB12029 TaxID=1314781 RepID=A0A165DXF8_EXIGL|nr:hypothetical protein EXIGLDRAFT_653952 [Exidia glandulosa HHB12029]
MPPPETTPPTNGPVFVPPIGPNELGSKSDEFKKRRGPVSCAECRRLKLKCDRRLPCSSCSKRGCAAICPNGTLAAGPGNRFVLADTQQLHEKISQMGKRITELEDALADLQAQISDSKHPLLADDLMLLKAPVSTANVASTMNEVCDSVTASLGTLTLGDRSNFVGPTASADYLLGDDLALDTAGSSCALPLEILLMANTFPLTSVREMRMNVMGRLSDFLPPAPDAWVLSELYYKNATWMFDLVPKEEFVETIFSVVYGGDTPSATGVTPHDLGIMFMILAIACMIDLNRPPYNTEASNYYQLARVALGVDSVIDHPTLQAVRGIHMMTTFLQMCDHPNGATACYSLLGLNSQLCQVLGLHRVDTQWNLTESERDKRRLIFWDVISFDAWTSLALGRPPCFSMAHVDAKLREDPERITSEDGLWEQSFRGWFHQFTKDCLLKVMDQAFGVAPLTYATVLRLDRLVREQPLSENLRLATECNKPGLAVPLSLQRNVTFTLTQRLLLYLHRSFFAQALSEMPDDPLKSKYAQSVLAAFRCALYITSSVRALYSQVPLCIRYFMFWSHAFSASIILGAIVLRSPGCGLAPAAWVELDRVYELFEQLGPKSRRIARILPKMRRLHKTAKEAYESFTSTQGGLEHRMQGCDVVDGDLKFFFGFTRVVEKASSPRRSTSTSPANSRNGLSQSPRTNGTAPSSSASSFNAASSSESSLAGGAVASTSTSSSSFNASSTLPTQGQNGDIAQLDFNQFLATLYPLGWPPAQQQQEQPSMQPFPLETQPPQMQQQQEPPSGQQQQQQQWTFEEWMASTAPIPMDGSFLPVDGANTFAQPAADTTSWTLPTAWVDHANDPLKTPSPETGARLLPGQNLDSTWQKFMDGIGLFDDASMLAPP